MSTAAPSLPCIYDGLHPQRQRQQLTPPYPHYPNPTPNRAEMDPKSAEDLIQPAPVPGPDPTLYKAAGVVAGGPVNHNNNSISVHSQQSQQHRRNVSITANCYLQMLTSPLKTYRERRAAAANLVDNSKVLEETQPKSVTDPSAPSGSEETNEKSNFQKDMETVMELVGALFYGAYAITLALFISMIPRRFRYKDIKDQVCLITGAGSGIGRLMAKKLALNQGAVIVAWDINKAGNDETVREIRAAGGKAYGYQVDVSSRENIYEVAAKVREEVGKVEILVNNAGVVSGKRFLEIPDQMIEKTMIVNTMSNFWTLKAFLPEMMKDGHGQIVTIASTAGLIGVNRLVDYCASKYAAIGINEAVQNELRAEGYKKIYLTCVCPYYINTGMFDGVRSKIVSILKPEAVVNDIIAGILTNQEQIVMPRWLYVLLLLKQMVPGEVGRRITTALGITGTMMAFKGRPNSPPPTNNGNVIVEGNKAA